MKLFLVISVLLITTACGMGRPYQASSIFGSEARLTGCALTEKTQFDQFSAEQLQWYQSRGELPIPEYRSQLHHGSNGRAVVIVHGFNSSPRAMDEVAVALNHAGFTVITPLLNGFSSNSAIANASSPDDWYSPIEKALGIARVCNSDVSLLSLSLGGTLAMDGLLNRGLTGISHFVGMSSFIEPSLQVRLVDGAFYPSKPALSISDIDQYLMGLDPFLFVNYQRPPAGAPPLYMPILALHAVLGYSDGLVKRSSGVSSVPLLEIVSLADGIMDVAATLAFSSAHFSNVTRIEYPKSDKISHSLESLGMNPHFEEMMRQIVSFLL